MGRMHADEVATDVPLVRRLLATQFPQWADLHIKAVASAGTDNTLYRLGDDMVVRLPRIHWAVESLAKEHEWLPRLAPLLPVAVPVPLGKGEPDLAPGNLLIVDGRLSAVIDFGGLGVGDPAVDLIVAWNLLSGDARDVFRDALRVDDATWKRGRGWALSVALIQLPYYRNTNPVLAASARHVIGEVLADHERTA